MTKANQTIVTLYFQAKAKLDQMVNEQHSILSDLDSKLSRGRYPTHDEAKIILHSLRELSLYFANYVEQLRDLAKSPATIAELKRNSDAEIIVTQQCLHTLMYPRHLALDFCGPPPIPKHWERVVELLDWFAYLGSTFSAGSSLISYVWCARQLFDDEFDSDFLEENCRLITDGIHDEHLRGLKHISHRATFLAEAEEDDVKTGDIDWWCSQMDSLFYEHKLLYHLDKCPNPRDKQVIAALNRLIETRTGLSQKTLERLSAFVRNGG